MTKKITALFLMTLIVAALAAFGCQKKAETTTESSTTTTTETSSSTSTTDTTMTAPADTAMSH